MAPRSRTSAAAVATATTGSAPQNDDSTIANAGVGGKGILLLMMPSVTDINGAGGVAARWAEYKRELETEGWTVELWTVDSVDEATKVPRYYLPNFPVGAPHI